MIIIIITIVEIIVIVIAITKIKVTKEKGKKILIRTGEWNNISLFAILHCSLMSLH